jgi:hypothetical protein
LQYSSAVASTCATVSRPSNSTGVNLGPQELPFHSRCRTPPDSQETGFLQLGLARPAQSALATAVPSLSRTHW